MANRVTLLSITLLSILFFLLILLPLIQCQNNNQGGKKLAPGVNNNNKNLNNIKNQKNNNNNGINNANKEGFQNMLNKLTPEQKQNILQKQKENKQLQDIEKAHENAAEDVKPFFSEEPKTLQTKFPSPCEDNESFSHFKLNTTKNAVPDFIFLSSSLRHPTSPQSFSRLLSFHENIRSPRIVEPQFFSYPWISKVNPRVYQSIFSNSLETSDKSELVGDFSSTYLFHPLAPKRIATQLPDMKVIIMLPDPVERAYSAYLDRVNEGLEFLSFEQIISREFKEVPILRKTFRGCFNEAQCDKSLCIPRDGTFISHDAEQTPHQLRNEADVKDYLLTSYVFRSIYDDMVERWLNSFPRENIFIFSQEQFFQERFRVLSNITEFLGLPPHTFTMEEKEEEEEIEEIEEEEDIEENPITTPLALKTQATLCKFFANYNNRLFRLIGEEFEWNDNCDSINERVSNEFPNFTAKPGNLFNNNNNNNIDNDNQN